METSSFAAKRQLASKKSGFDPFCIVECPGLPACAADAKNHLQKMLDRGWSPLYDLDLDAAAKLAKKNVGGIVPKRASLTTLGMETMSTPLYHRTR